MRVVKYLFLDCINVMLIKNDYSVSLEVNYKYIWEIFVQNINNRILNNQKIGKIRKVRKILVLDKNYVINFNIQGYYLF